MFGASKLAKWLAKLAANTQSTIQQVKRQTFLEACLQNNSESSEPALYVNKKQFSMMSHQLELFC